MAEDNVEFEPVAEEEEPSNYKPPPEKTLEEMIQQDTEDESLRKYKEALLGTSAAGAIVLGNLHSIISVPRKQSRHAGQITLAVNLPRASEL